MQFTKMRRADIPSNFDDAVKDLIVAACEAGGQARLSAKGHIIIRNRRHQTMAVSRNSGSARGRGWLNTRADVMRLFPGALVPPESAAPPEVPQDRMCNRCKERHSVEEFEGGPYCPGCRERFEIEAEAAAEEPEALELPEEVKECSRCNKVKPHSEFYRNRRDKTGRQSYCISCTKEYVPGEKGRRPAQPPQPVHEAPVVTQALREAHGWSEGRQVQPEEARALQEAAQVVDRAGRETVQAAVAFEAIKKLVAGDLIAEIEGLKAENERLRESLRRVRAAVDEVSEVEA